MGKSIHATEADIHTHQSLTETLGLQELCVVGSERDEVNNRLILTCVPRHPVAVCPRCTHISQDVHDYPHQRRIHDAPIRGYATLLVFDRRRFWCEACQRAFSETIQDVVANCTYTYRLAECLADARRKQDVATLAATHGLGYKLVERILLKSAEDKLQQRARCPLAVEHLGIDEIALRKGHGDYVLVLTDLQRRVVLDMLPDRKQQSLIDWLTCPPQGIQLDGLICVATDLWTAYREAVYQVYPNVSVVADRFHVVHNLNEAIHKLRREAQRDAKTEEEQRQLKGLRYLLLKDESKWTQEERARIEALKQTHPKLYQLVTLRQRLHDWYETDTTPELASLSLDEWLNDAAKLGLKALNTFCNTLPNWKTEITNFFQHRVTSGFVEGMNSKIKLIKRIAFGIPNFSHFRLRIIAACA